MTDQLGFWGQENDTSPKEKHYNNILKSTSIELFRTQLRGFHCTRCALSSEIEQNPTTSRGNPNSNIMLVGEAPGHQEMIQGIPFVGKAGQLMDKIFEAIDLITERDVYITNICRCRPVNNRAPLSGEAKKCMTYLKKEIELIKPKFILTLGATSSKYLLGKNLPIKSMKDTVGRFYVSSDYPNIEFFVIYHPAALLYNANLKKPMWEHMKLFKSRLNSVA